MNPDIGFIEKVLFEKNYFIVDFCHYCPQNLEKFSSIK